MRQRRRDHKHSSVNKQCRGRHYKVQFSTMTLKSQQIKGRKQKYGELVHSSLLGGQTNGRECRTSDTRWTEETKTGALWRHVHNNYAEGLEGRVLGRVVEAAGGSYRGAFALLSTGWQGGDYTGSKDRPLINCNEALSLDLPSVGVALILRLDCQWCTRPRYTPCHSAPRLNTRPGTGALWTPFLQPAFYLID